VDGDGKRSRPTAAVVARTAQVSRVAVSRAFNPDASIRPEKRAHILRVAQQLNYTPDMAARSMATGRSHLVALIVPDLSSPWEAQEVDAMTAALQDAGFATLVFRTRDDFSFDEKLLTYMKGFNPDSVISYAENVRPGHLARGVTRAVPVYVCYPEADPGTTADGGYLFDRLDVRMRAAFEAAIARMQAAGARRFALLSGKAASLATAARAQLVRSLLAARGLPPPDEIAGDYSYDTAARAVLAYVRAGGRADAIVSANDVGACGAVDALRHGLGLRVPQDVQVLGFDDIRMAHWQSYDLTTLQIDVAERTAALMRLVRRRLDEPAAGPLTETIAARLVVRGTA
jgi:DNA-binding LacI/PurR family transcriptional regulator